MTDANKDLLSWAVFRKASSRLQRSERLRIRDGEPIADYGRRMSQVLTIRLHGYPCCNSRAWATIDDCGFVTADDGDIHGFHYILGHYRVELVPKEGT